MLHEYVIKNNIVLFQKGPLSNWYGAWSGQENGQFKVTIDSKSYKILYHTPIVHPTSYDETFGKEYEKEIKFNCSEQAMMYVKAVLFQDFTTAEKILETKQPAEQKALGREVKNFKKEVWDQWNMRLVKSILVAKFTQNPDLRKFLCEDLKDYILAEAAPWDKVWGIGLAPGNEKAWNVKTWEGKNLLGKCLMRVRDELSE